jgi:HEAT repeat protein
VASLEDILGDSGTSGRATAALLLGTDSSKEVFDALRDALKDKEGSVRAAAVHSIALRNDPSLLDDIAPLINDSKSSVRFRAAAAYVRLIWVKAGAPTGARKGAQPGE